MSPESDGLGVVRCSFEKAVIEEDVKTDLRTAIRRVHEATIYVTELLNLEIRRQLEAGNDCPDYVFNKNELAHAFQSVVSKNGEFKPHPLFRDAMTCMPHFDPVKGTGLTNAMQHVSNNLVAVATNNVKMHFRSRAFRHVKVHHELSKEDYAHLSKEDRQAWKLELYRITDDLCSPSAAHDFTSNERYHAWIRSEQARFGFDEDVQPTRLCMERSPAKFVKAMYLMSLDAERVGKRAFSLYPLRHNLVTKFIELDNKTLNEVLQAMRNERLSRKRKLKDDDTFSFATVFNFRAANLRQGWRLANTVSTDGVSLHIKQYKGTPAQVQTQRLKHDEKIKKRTEARLAKAKGEVIEKKKQTPKVSKPPLAPCTTVPNRGIWAIDQLKHLSRESFHVVSLDPGKHELFCAVDSENAGSKTGVCRYTLRTRRKELRTMQYEKEGKEGKHPLLQEGEDMLSMHNSRSASLKTFQAYCRCRRMYLQLALEFYGRLDHRQRRWKRGIKKQQADAWMVKKLSHFQTDNRPLVLAYGSWGVSAGKTHFKGLPPCIGKGLMKTLAKSFAVVVTPEHYTSKTCYKCDATCDAHPTLHRTKTVRSKDGLTTKTYPIRGLRVCQNEECKQFMNRDRLGAYNIGRNFDRLFRGEAPLRRLTSQEDELNRLKCSLCEEE
jgi:hypothetical protein